jgi:hypothetical protein
MRKEGVLNDPLHPNDSEDKTYGCRHSNPDICGKNSMLNVCAFVREDGICLEPLKSWKKQYRKLQKSGENS